MQTSEVDLAVFDVEFGWANDKIARHLQAVALEFGPTDFPGDGGVSFRNELFGFADCFACVVKHFPEIYPDDYWLQANYGRVLKATRDEIFDVIGVLHIFEVGYHFNKHLHGHNAAQFVQDYRIVLDWLFNTYDFDEDRRKEWHRLIATTKDNSKYNAFSKANMYLEVARALDLRESDGQNSSAWCGFAFMLGLSRSELIQSATWAEHCRVLDGILD